MPVMARSAWLRMSLCCWAHPQRPPLPLWRVFSSWAHCENTGWQKTGLADFYQMSHPIHLVVTCLLQQMLSGRQEQDTKIPYVSQAVSCFPFGTPQHPELTSIQTLITKNYELVFLLLCFPYQTKEQAQESYTIQKTWTGYCQVTFPIVVTVVYQAYYLINADQTIPDWQA